MTFIDSLLGTVGYFDLPQGVGGWVVWVLALAGNGFLVYRFRAFQREKTRLRQLSLVVLLILTPLTSVFIGVHIPSADALPVPGRTLLPTGAALMFFAALPWCLAAGFLGAGWSGILAGLSGFILGYYDHHNLFIPLAYMLMGTIFGWLIGQQYRTRPYKVLRHPVMAGLVLILSYPVLFIISSVLITGDILVVRLDFALSQLPASVTAFTGQLLMGVMFVQVLAILLPSQWVGAEEEVPSPAEASLEANLVYRLLPLVMIFVLLVLIGLGILLLDANRRQLVDQMEHVAESSASSIPFTLETGQNLIVQLAEDPRLAASEEPEVIQEVLVEYLKRVPFFNQLTYLDQDKNLLAGYPLQNIDHLFLTIEEIQAIDLALSGVGFQSYSLPPASGEEVARLVFVVSVHGPEGQNGVILGRTTLDQNPLFIPVLDNLNTLTETGGAGMLVDEQGMVLFHPDPDLVGTFFPQDIDLTQPYFDRRNTSSAGTREMLYILPVPGRSWAIVTTIPVSVSQQAALELSLSLFFMLVVLVIILFGALRLAVRSVIREIGKLARDAEQIASGELDMALQTDHVDEVGQLALAVDGMRVSLKARMEEVDQLLAVSKGVASSLDLSSAVAPILRGALSTGASSARLVLSDQAAPEFETDIRTQYGEGDSARTYRKMDQQILKMTMQRPEVLLTNPARARLQNMGDPLPKAILAYALMHEETQYGALWIAYDDAHRFSEDERRFVQAVAGQAALAAANARLYLSARLGRQRMESILAATPEPVIVTDFQNQFLLVNPAAQELLGRSLESLIGEPVSEVIKEKLLRQMLLSDATEETAPQEITFDDGRVFFGTASPVVIEDGKRVGRVCLLRDITHYKALDEMKSDFVETVNHDLRSPLTTIRGYATMLDMVGDLNDQQTRYVEKIGQSVDRMYRLVNTLLDIGRIEAGVDLRLEWLPLADLVRQVADNLQINAAQKRIAFKVELPESTLPMVQADRALLEQAIQNVIDNAIKYTDTGGKVTVTLKTAEEQRAVIEVSDTGSGISPVDLPRIFERFYRAVDRNARQDAGNGLGLAIVKSIIERHHGSVTVESKLGSGSKFSLKLPLRQPEK